MSILKVQEFDKLILCKKAFPAYLFLRAEYCFIDIFIKKIEKLFFINNFDKEIFYGSEFSDKEIFNSLLTLPLFSNNKIVIIKEVNKIKTVVAEILTKYLSSIVKTSCLILFYSGNWENDNVYLRKNFISKSIISKNCITVDCMSGYKNRMKEFVKSEFLKKRKIISDDIVLKIINENNNLLDISNEIEKISLFMDKDEDSVTYEHLEKISGSTKEFTLYTLLDNIENKNLKGSFLVLEKLFIEKIEPTKILFSILSIVRKLIIAKSMIYEQNVPINIVESKINLYSFYSKKFFLNLKKHDINVLKKSFKIILKADIAIKTCNIDVNTVLEELIIFICS
ncbi:MAG: DNA polymerase III subunit delta [Endomicrobium sp.]|jgi:DNA polymerase-3 subunit delta|nr:DNA polymerase III subunit delta [Endomicrobium sp.]